MTLSELIAAVGDDNVIYQALATDSTLVRKKRERGQQVGEVVFNTDPRRADDLMFDNPTHIGLVVWLPIDRLPESMRVSTTKEPNE